MRIGFLYGGSLHSRPLEFFNQVVDGIHQRYGNEHTTVMIGGPRAKTCCQEHHPALWTNNVDELTAHIKSFNIDLGVQILPNDQISFCKSNVKWLHWTLAGVPLLAPAFGQYSRTPNIHLYSSVASFYKQLQTILTQPDLLKPFAGESLKAMRKGFTTAECFKELESTLAQYSKVAFFNYSCQWRVWQPIEYFKSLGKQILYSEGSDLSIDKDTLLFIPRYPISRMATVEKLTKKAGYSIYDIDDLLWEEGSYYYNFDWAVPIPQVPDLFDLVTVSTAELKDSFDNFTYHRMKSVVRPNGYYFK